MATYSVEVEFQPNPEKAFWAEGSIKQMYNFTREQLDGIANAFNDYISRYPQRLAIKNLANNQLFPMGDLAYTGIGIVPGARVNCSTEADVPLTLPSQYSSFELKQVKRYVLSATTPDPRRFYPSEPHCAYTFNTMNYLQGFFWVLSLFGVNPLSLNLRLYDRTAQQEIPIPYPA